MRIARRDPEPGSTPLGLVFGAVLALGAALAAVWIRFGLPRPGCLFREWTGVPCPTCGSTRVVGSLFAGDVVGAASWNPLVFAVLVGVAAWALLSAARLAFRLPVWHVELTRRERLALRIAAALAIAANWIVVGVGL